MHPEDEDKSGLLEENGIWLFTGDVDDDTYADTIRWIMEENIDSKHEALTMVIHSQGGDLNSGFAICDCMAGSHIPIRTLGLGVVASMGLLMFIAGKKGERILTPNTLVMSHQWAGSGANGKEHELLAGIKGNNLVSDMVLRHYKNIQGCRLVKSRNTCCRRAMCI